jgi:hypothetical protein
LKFHVLGFVAVRLYFLNLFDFPEEEKQDFALKVESD